MYTMIDGENCNCDVCGAKRADVGFKIQTINRWANQHGRGFDISCSLCNSSVRVEITSKCVKRYVWFVRGECID
jgi:hypothetical protein